jgi:hypothetical protein
MALIGVFGKVNGVYALTSTQQNFVKTNGEYFQLTGFQLVIKANGVYNTGTGEIPVNLTPPVIAGAADFGATLTCTPGTWDGDPVPVISHRWYADAMPLIGETGLTHVVTETDVGHVLTCHERATNVVGSIDAISNGIAIPAAAFSSAFSDAFDNG